MSDNGEDEEEPVVELGDGPDVEGAPVSRVASRLFFPIEESEVLRREGETTVRTPDGPQTVADVLGQSDEVYFETNADLVNAVRSVVGTGPVPTAGGGGSDAGGDSEPEPEQAPDADDEQGADEEHDADEESEAAEPEEGPEGAGESDDEEVAEDAETAESPPAEPEEDEGNLETDAEDGEADPDEEGEFEFDAEE